MGVLDGWVPPPYVEAGELPAQDPRSSSSPVSYCTRCGAVVYDEALHTRWHESVGGL